ncbi:3-deoxy-D-manno-octulosonate 8-phosphate phosphatase (KDO 8-P phosphatase) [Silvimonas terrae]|uniref:3-deoxy-D-manno-octulosonate 8-phosphate phosphatase KdsC n=1 Tax=Silvimonas terrae TaxID=300266 RepID=A0A840RLL1_9NEIS|nr:HAD-IIIA family hydrolase [Silvimonas terrae]MBB5193073.1 3-deoxy-D-manno-octulosonate 8-phosphate phosphatase (KDO 8-P phosphatase) [Silvimonas terrae]
MNSQAATAVRLMIFDVDGVMTDGSLYYTDAGEELKAFNALDGHGIRMLQDSGVKVAIITGRKSRLVEHRARNLNIDLLYQGASDKLATFAELLAATGLTQEQCGYMGDDVIDLPVMRRVAFAISVPDAPQIVRDNAHLVTVARAGHGAVREACETIMQSQGTLDGIMAWYLR